MSKHVLLLSAAGLLRKSARGVGESGDMADPRLLQKRGDSASVHSSSQGASSLYDDDDDKSDMYKHGVGNAGDVSESDNSDVEWDEEQGGSGGGAYGTSLSSKPHVTSLYGLYAVPLHTLQRVNLRIKKCFHAPASELCQVPM